VPISIQQFELILPVQFPNTGMNFGPWQRSDPWLPACRYTESFGVCNSP